VASLKEISESVREIIKQQKEKKLQSDAVVQIPGGLPS
jgi:hypothetical protein